MTNLTSGLLWLASPAVKPDVELEKAVSYTEGKLARPVVLINHPPDESYPADWRGIPLRPDKRVQAHHIYVIVDAGADAAAPEAAPAG